MVNRWLYSTNAKDIGTLYLIFALFSGLLGTLFSLVIRLELMGPGVQILQGNHQFFNVVVTAHAMLMVFYFIMPALIGGFGNLEKNTIDTKGIINRSENLNKSIGPYLAGLIEGDGTICVG
ncbi:Intron-encoded DNA endonuclease aI3 [Smittium culicis]|uniref:Cytochrome c oxidase subunit 1 n=1 Tax=Smittium culicis TaxID=133412 RepID=A0A1R1WXH2_9FUNG|nr:Intron-encoded DNA endonuclease aI3 [Smittium culicis]